MADSVDVSDEIPVGSPPAPPGRHAAPGGWYPDPVDTTRERYWDGWQWSRQTREAPVTQRPAANAPTAGESDGRLAGWWHRALAAIIDSVVLFVVATGLLSRLYLTISERMQPVIDKMFAEALNGEPITPLRPQELMSQQEQLIILLVTLAVALVYHVGLLRWRGQTLGKIITGLRVVPADDHHARGLSWRAAIMRSLMWVLPGQHTCLWPVRIVDIVMPVTNPAKQALHDRVASTQVIRLRSR